MCGGEGGGQHLTMSCVYCQCVLVVAVVVGAVVVVVVVFITFSIAFSSLTSPFCLFLACLYCQ